MPILDQATLRQLRIFEAAARHAHFGRAAVELHLTQPAVSIQLGRLEEIVGVPLFEPVARRMQMTRAGEELLVHVRDVIARLRNADISLQAFDGTSGGDLHIACTTTAEYFVPRLLAAFRKRHPLVKINLSVSNREAVVRDLSENSVDMALMGRAPRGLDLIAVPFAPHPLVIVAPPNHRLAGRRRAGLSDLAGETFLIRERGSGTRSAMEGVFSRERFQPSETMEFGSNETIKQAVMAGMGVGFLSLHTVGLEVTTGRLAVLSVARTPVMRDWYVIHRRRKRLAGAANAFRDYLLGEGTALIAKATGTQAAASVREGSVKKLS